MGLRQTNKQKTTSECVGVDCLAQHTAPTRLRGFDRGLRNQVLSCHFLTSVFSLSSSRLARRHAKPKRKLSAVSPPAPIKQARHPRPRPPLLHRVVGSCECSGSSPRQRCFECVSEGRARGRAAHARHQVRAPRAQLGQHGRQAGWGRKISGHSYRGRLQVEDGVPPATWHEHDIPWPHHPLHRPQPWRPSHRRLIERGKPFAHCGGAGDVGAVGGGVDPRGRGAGREQDPLLGAAHDAIEGGGAVRVDVLCE